MDRYIKHIRLILFATSYISPIDIRVYSNDSFKKGGARMYIKPFASKYQLSVDTIRFYEKEGILNPKRLVNGYRL